MTQESGNLVPAITMPPARTRMELVTRMRGKYIKTDRDDRICRELQACIDDLLASLDTRDPEGSMLLILGASGAGKTCTLERAFELVSGIDKGNYLHLSAPSPCTLKQLGRNLLIELGYPLHRELADHLIWEKVRFHLRECGIQFIWIDEAHHSMGRCTPNELRLLRDTLKSIMQQRKWPVTFFLSGLPMLSAFFADDTQGEYRSDFQIERRSHTVHMPPLAFPADAAMMRDIVKEIVVKHAGMRIDCRIETDEFVHRLLVAAERGLGSTIAMVRQAVLRAFMRAGSEAIVGIDDFAEVYGGMRSCSLDTNIFLVSDWLEIVPSNSRLEHAPSLGVKSGKRRKMA